MRRVLPFLLALGLSAFASGTTYYVSSSSGSDASDGLSVTTAWQTLARVNSQALLPGDSVLLTARRCVE